jgi:hypothetical protein
MKLNLSVVEGKLLNYLELIQSLLLLAKNKDNTLELVLDDAPALEFVTIIDTTFLKFLEIFCRENNIDKKRIILFSGNLIQDMSVWPTIKKIAGLNPLLHGQNISYNVNKTFEKTVGIFIGRCSWSRLYLSSYVYEQFHNNSLISFWQHHFDPSQPANLCIDEMLLRTLQDRDCLARVSRFCERLPIHLADKDRAINKNIGTISYFSAYELIKHYNKIFLEVICETMHNKNTFYLTEKISRCLITKTPFLLYGPIGYLKNLQTMGFKTFNHFWSEDYDQLGEYKRIEKIKEILIKIKKYDLEKIKKLYASMQDILDHNQKVYKNLSREDIAKMFNCTVRENNEL